MSVEVATPELDGRRPGRARRLLVLGAVSVGLLAGIGALVAWPVAERLCAGWDRAADDEIDGLTRDGLGPLPGAPDDDGPDATAALRPVFDALRLTDVEREAAQLESSLRLRPDLWLEPGAAHDPADERRPLEPTKYDPARHRALADGLRARIEAQVAPLDSALASGAWWRLTDLPRGPPGASTSQLFRDLRLLLDLRGGPGRWGDLARLGRLAAMRRETGWRGVHFTDDAAFSIAFRLALLLAVQPVDPDSARSLEVSLTALDRPDACAQALREGFATTLERLTPDAEGMTRFDLMTPPGHPFRRFGELRRTVLYHCDRRCWVSIQARMIRALAASRGAARPEVEGIEAEVAACNAYNCPLTRRVMVMPSQWLERGTRSLAKLRMSRMAIAIATTAQRAGALPEEAPLVLDDPYTTPPRPLRWRVTGSRTGLLASVGPDGADDGGAEETYDGDGRIHGDVLLPVALP